MSAPARRAAVVFRTLLLVTAPSVMLASCTLGLEFEAAELDVPSRPDVDTSLPPPLDTTESETLLGEGPDEDDPEDASDAHIPVAGCGDGVVQRDVGERCDPGPAGSPGCNSSCQVVAGWVCGGTGLSRCVQPTERLVLTGDLDLNLDVRDARTGPDGSSSAVSELRATSLRTVVPLDVEPGDELIIFAPVSGDAPGRYTFAFVEGVSGTFIELDREVSDEHQLPLVAQRVPHFRSVDVGPHRLTVSPLEASDGRGELDGGTNTPGSGFLVMRVSETLRVGDGGRIDVSGLGLATDLAPQASPRVGDDGESGLLSWGARGGFGPGVGEENRGGSGATGCGCPSGPSLIDNGLGAGGGGGSPCSPEPECCPGCSQDTIGSSGAGGGLPVQYASPAETNGTTLDLTRITHGAGGVTGGGGGAASTPVFLADGIIPTLDDCAPPQGGAGTGHAGHATTCRVIEQSNSTEPSETTPPGPDGTSGLTGGRGGGVIWLMADSIEVEDGGSVVADGEHGGRGGDGGRATHGGAGGGGGAGGQGGSGGTIVLDAAQITLPTDDTALRAAGGRGGDGGSGGAVEDAPGGAGGAGGVYLRGAHAGASGEPGVEPGTGGGGRGGRAGFEGRVILRYEKLNGFSFGVGPDVSAVSEPQPDLVDRTALPED